ncbi:anti-sigma factor antagonist [Nocardia alba]|uniref:Anti-sigma factor antagonist n=1 Tax=Nocardia alba TaxID=225051 RepID=A0A4R1FFV5_9NOCA|nr:anti-sigma factor antagonist [Nocardia alba]TCJ89741.1 anti-anti-sigma factor [Nocardia alba]
MNTHSSHGDQISRVDQTNCALRAEVTRRHAATVVHVRGEIDACNLSQWRGILDDAVLAAAGSDHLVIDLRDVTFMSCRAILDMATRAQQSELRMSVVNPVPSVTNRIIVAAGLTEWLPVYSSRTDALAAAGSLPRSIPTVSWTTM